MVAEIGLIYLLDGGSGTSLAGSGGSTAAWGAAHVWDSAGASVLVHLGNDGHASGLKVLLLRLKLFLLSHLVGIEPADDLVALVEDGLLVVVGDLALELLVLDGAL